MHEDRKVTIYCKAAGGNIARIEGYFIRVEDHGPNLGADVIFIKKRGRSECTVMSYYSSFWMVVDGWGHPQPDGLFLPGSRSETGCEVARGRYRSCDPSWVGDFLADAGAELKPIAMYRDGVLQMDLTTN
jgi:hypothetical protein